MIFECEGRKWDTNDMHELDADGDAEWCIYVTRDYRHVFVFIVDNERGVTVQCVKGGELLRLVEKYKDPVLIAACNNQQSISN